MKKVFTVLVTIIFLIFLCVSSVSAEKIAKPTNTLTTNGNGGKTDVGAWFMTYNNGNMWASNFGSGYPIRFRTLMPDGSYGILDSSNVEHIDFMLKQIADAKIDFLIYDITNGGLTNKLSMGGPGLDENGLPKDEIVQNAILTSRRIVEWNKKNNWKIKYCVAVGVYEQLRKSESVGNAVEYQAEATYKYFFEQDFGGDNYYQVDGKPMFIIFDWASPALKTWNSFKGNKTYGDKFFVRAAQQGEAGTYGWQTNVGSAHHEEVIVVCPGHDQAGAGRPNVSRSNGEYYKKSWEVVLNNTLPRFVVITSFNDYNEQTAVWIADSSKCREGVEEKWTDKTGKINNSMYWEMTKEGIRLVRTYNGEVKGKFKSTIFNLGDEKTEDESDSNKSNSNKVASNKSDSNKSNSNKVASNKSDSNKTTIIVIITVIAVMCVVGCGLLLTIKKNK